jgi:hypothetical protein
VRSQPLALALAGLGVALAAAGALGWGGAATRPSERLSPASDTRADFALRRGDHASRLRVQTASLLPGATLELAAQGREGAPLPLRVSGAHGLEQRSPERVRFRAGAAPALHALRVGSAASREEIQLNVFVVVPRTRLRARAPNGFEIGAYPAADPDATPPAGFIEVTEANQSTPVSPRFRLRDFLCKQAGDWPKYLVLDERLPPKLEALLDRARAAGIRASALTVMSGFRTPAYHRAIGNATPRSRHLWGAGADVFVDEDGDAVMDDLDGNGRVDERDAAVLLALADALDREPAEDWHVGGASAYRATDAHGPFLHLDVRGRAARW